MKTFAHDDFERARLFIDAHGRALEQALFAWHFRQGSQDNVQQELAAFQNGDGGFGHALEPDLRTPLSSALATGIALHILVELDVVEATPQVMRAVAFLIDQYQSQTKKWRVIPAGANVAPHAPWWTDKDGILERTFDNFRIIPRVQLVAHLYHFRGLVQSDWLDMLARDCVRTLEMDPDLGSGGGSDMEYALLLQSAVGLPTDLKTRLQVRLRDVAVRAVKRRKADWSTYCITPLKLAPRPDGLLAQDLHDDVQRQLDYLIDTQSDEGGWWPVWSWGDSFPEIWQHARADWAGVITLENLRILQAYGRLQLAE